MKPIGVTGYKRIYKKKHEFDVCVTEGKTKRAYEIAKEELTKASFYHLFQICLEYTVICKNYHSVIDPHKYKWNYYNGLYNKYKSLVDFELGIDEQYLEFLKKVVVENQKPKEAYARPFLQAIQDKRITFKSAKNSFHAIMVIYRALGKTDELGRVCESAISYFEGLPFKSEKPLHAFALSLLQIYIKERQHNDAEGLVAKVIPNNRTENYFRFCQLRAINFLHWGKYNECAAWVYSLHPRSMSPVTKSAFHLYKGYCAALNELGLIQGDYPFDFLKLRKGIDLVKSDKEGENYHSIIIELLHLYATDKGVLIDREAAFNKYMKRYSKPGSRFHTLLSGLIKWINSSYRDDLSLVSEKLKEFKPYEFGLEVIPYEHIVDILRFCQKKRA